MPSGNGPKVLDCLLGGYTGYTMAPVLDSQTSKIHYASLAIKKFEPLDLFLLPVGIIVVFVAIRLDRWHARRYWRQKTQQGEAGVCLHSADGRRHVRVRPAERP
ncbi:MAG: hypothetical protein H6905_11690 [Hyphomicrobiales bacterium]|nr:hypothetical protein [Hyphomicrobiales bacterium]